MSQNSTKIKAEQMPHGTNPFFHVIFETGLALTLTCQRLCQYFVHLALKILKDVFLLTPESLTNTWHTFNPIP